MLEPGNAVAITRVGVTSFRAVLTVLEVLLSKSPEPVSREYVFSWGKLLNPKP